VYYLIYRRHALAEPPRTGTERTRASDSAAGVPGGGAAPKAG